MSVQGPIVVVAEQRPCELLDALATVGAFQIIETSCAKAAVVIATAEPSAILLADTRAATDVRLAASLARNITCKAPIVPVIAYAGHEHAPPYREALLIGREATPAAVAARLASVLRVRNLHAGVLRRAEASQRVGHSLPQIPANDPLEDATIILAGRGRSYPELSVSLGEQTGLIGVLTIEAAARHLRSRDADGLVIGEGFSPRNVEALLTVVAEDSRFRDLPIGIVGQRLSIGEKELPHLVSASGPVGLVARILPLVRLHAFEARLRRTLEAFDRQGVVDPATGLLYRPAFVAELERVMRDAGGSCSGLSLARFSFDASFDARALNDAARLIGKLVRGADFACRDDNGSILVAFTETDLRRAQTVSKRLASVLKNTMLQPGRKRIPATPAVSLAGRKTTDTVKSLLGRIITPAVATE